MFSSAQLAITDILFCLERYDLVVNFYHYHYCTFVAFRKITLKLMTKQCCFFSCNHLSVKTALTRIGSVSVLLHYKVLKDLERYF